MSKNCAGQRDCCENPNRSQSPNSKFGILEPKERIKVLSGYSTSISVDPNVPPKRYYRSGLEMVRMANVYLAEGSYENAYVLYLKFMTLFLEKIRAHPQFSTVPADMKILNQTKMREVLPKTEKLKQRLLEQYTKEYNEFLADEEAAEKARKNKPKTSSTVPLPNIADIRGGKPMPTPGINRELPDRASGGLPNPPSGLPSVSPTAPPYNQLDNKHSGGSLPKGSTTFKFGSLRSVIIPSKLISHFLNAALKNTLYNIETCGILSGELERDRLVITHAIIPQQKGTPDSCTTMNEEQIFDYQDANNLITIGWIHTHPTQTAFLSSVDLHTHCPYQTLLPEALAIVCAPKFDETGFFQLTAQHGLAFIANCRLSGFHPHPAEPPLFMNAEHIKLDPNGPIQLVDFRK